MTDPITTAQFGLRVLFGAAVMLLAPHRQWLTRSWSKACSREPEPVIRPPDR